MKDPGKIIKCMEMALIYGQLARSSRANGKTISLLKETILIVLGKGFIQGILELF